MKKTTLKTILPTIVGVIVVSAVSIGIVSAAAPSLTGDFCDKIGLKKASVTIPRKLTLKTANSTRLPC